MKGLNKWFSVLGIAMVLVLVSPVMVTQIVITAEAATVKLNKTSATVNIGKTVQLKMKGTKSKVTWKSSNTKIAKVSATGKVTGVGAGHTTITAKVGKKNYKCTVIVNFSATDAKKGISVTYETAAKQVVAIVKNNNKYPVSVDATMVYYDAGKKMIGTSTNESYCLEAGRECALNFYFPTDPATYDYIVPDSYVLNYKVSEPTAKGGYAKNIAVDYDLGVDGVVIHYTNNAKKDLEFIPICILMYDEADRLIGAETSFAYCEAAGSDYYSTVYYPYDDDYNVIIPASVKVYINGAYYY